jgi:hypothetical protein
MDQGLKLSMICGVNLALTQHQVNAGLDLLVAVQKE